MAMVGVSYTRIMWTWTRVILIQITIIGNMRGIECSPVPVPVPEIAKSFREIGMLPEKTRYEQHRGSTAPESKIGKRDLWELVSSTSDVIPMGNENNSAVVGLSSSPRYQDFSAATSILPSTISSHLNVQMRLNKLQYYFGGLRIFEEDCRQRLICEISTDPAKFAPLSAAFLDETSYNGDEKMLSARLLTSNEGTRLLTYMEAAHRGLNREGCDIWAYRCPQTTETLIDFKSLLTWREVLKWLTVKMVAKRY